ncbi:MAG TPA: hypothetical protein DCS07_08955 [Bdellovibrionales bacterium]|nr:MAG: hypothetical protein A2Z97_15165 [Bdellovibrionales bacterium GWB1_52_6]OFZ03892.1 MAG: hypothetical protein A2X97_15955 [Bdellovibrionales bacterium GWA1_52_35]OFZ39475.1 MAG: hypothetical protein A2070_06660 [Bdellovibrionales bacterium GWC1_52_8]HAR42739.1 hypothetical protein [Bdellovibrionales bacterium]HCM39673.1 hypothetical protein [Bdellovibrionales bacterium]
MTQSGCPASAETFSPESQNWSTGPFRTLWLPALICLLILAGEIYFLLADISEQVKGAPVQGVPVAVLQSLDSKASLKQVTNGVRHKAAGTLIWAVPQPGQSLFRQDSIATLADSESVVIFPDESEVVIEPESLIVFEDLPTQGPAQITARIVKGSLYRRKAGKLPLVLKVGNSHSELRINDERSDAIFRVIARGHGVEVIVQSGAVVINGSQRIAAKQKAVLADLSNGRIEVQPEPPLQKMAPPRLRRPRIEIKPRTLPQQSSFWFPMAFAAETDINTIEISIHFTWEATAGAQQYKIQIAADPEFQKLITEQVVKEPLFNYITLSPEADSIVYFRVAGINSQDDVGEFSAFEKVEIKPEIKPAPVRVPLTQQKIKLQEKPQKKPQKKPEDNPLPFSHPKPKPPEIAQPRRSEPPMPLRAEIALGLIFQSRSFKSDLYPNHANGNGWIPGSVRGEVDFPAFEKSRFRLGLTAILENVSAKGGNTPLPPGVQATASAPLVQVWGVFEKSFWGVGPYLSNSSQFSWREGALTSHFRPLAGALFQLNTRRYRIQIAPILIGAQGADLSFQAKFPFSLAPDWFLRGGLTGRWLKMETSYGGIAEVGYGF